MTEASLSPRKHWIDNQEADPRSGEVYEKKNPATGEVLVTHARGRREDVDAAVASARAAFPGWARMDPNERARILWKAGEAIMARLEELARLEVLDTGKPIANARLIDVPRTADTFFYYSGWATKIHGETIPVRGPFLNYTIREPLGVIGAIIPWNFPLLIAARKVAPALAAGNVVVLKPPEEASLTSLELARILAEAGVPPGVLNVITGFGEEAGAPLVEHPDVAKITFTGGTDTGRLIMRAASATLKKVSLELGGKSPNIVFADADVPAAARAAVLAAFYNQGEICTAGSRLLVERKVHDEVLGIVAAGAKNMQPGDPLEPGTQLGPLVSEAHLARVMGYIQRGEAEGARKEIGGGSRGPGYFVEPTVFSAVSEAMTIAREEIFGPVLSVIPFDDLDEAARIADATEYGLAAGIWTRDVGKAHALAARVRAGTVWINTFNRFDAASPYGGMKQSGFGRENGRAVLDELTQIKSVWVALG
ncbi:MAG TPA: aldehyde dehydrogenase family protein [Candidatus Nanopelagicales bacterium]|nr:aldehyde dehydrogenase family protein [Candidatus Nanopelagicales bacterium]